MKKLLLALTIMLVIVLGACNSVSDTKDLENRVTELEAQVDKLEDQIIEVEQILIDLEIIEGLNAQREYYLPESTETTGVFTSVSAATIELLGGELDKTKAPSYVLDANEEYIPFSDVAQLLVSKYFDGANVNSASIGITTQIVLDVGNISQEEFIAKTILLIEELSNYDFYIIGSTQLVIQTDFNSTARIIIPIQTLRSSFITIIPDIIINGTYEISKVGFNYDSQQVIDLYNGYVTDGLFTGYALNLN